ncbi:MAG: YggS family pyridoxal phosphate-dependent enzyme [Candidatus Dormibacteraeota bacterium]|nr:YggS family pyridoxal phosphate-dependent enzyme [Candidatus Dormibacteraeota bacterium]MBO0760601.1 YggS family pyridoxal phosphate-dependent enzyme [Candidatus Dormibacteraeota bacterium]
MERNLAEVRRRIRAAGPDPDAVTIVAVTKNHGSDTCRAALAAGLTVLGENRVQEALPKMAEVHGAEWHLIGHLQTNKARQAGAFALVQSLDSVRLADVLAERAPVPVLLEINVSREAEKHGVAPEEAEDVAAQVATRLDLRGVMGMGPVEGDPRPAFRELRALRERIEQRVGRGLPILSMGMSGDFETAVREGSTMVRLGTVLFGPRDVSHPAG